MTESSPTSTKTKGVAGTIWYLHVEGVFFLCDFSWEGEEKDEESW